MALRRQDRLPRAHASRRIQIFKPLHDLRSCRPTPTQMGFRGPRPGPRLPAHPGPSRAFGPAWADPAPFQHSPLTDCPASDSALLQATIQHRPSAPAANSGPAQLFALTAASDSDDSLMAISLSMSLAFRRQARFRPQLAHRRSQLQATTAPQRPAGLPLRCQ